MARQKKNESAGVGPKTRDYFAELYVAGLMGDRGWAVYFPKRDIGFDFVVSKKVGDKVILRPVQVRGKYPTEEKKDRVAYPWLGELSQVHEDMALVLCYFATDHSTAAPDNIAFVPLFSLKSTTKGRYRCSPVNLKGGKTYPRPSYKHLFGVEGLDAMESSDWAQSGPPPAEDA